ncbi:MAG: ABC transporter ATP-binding protein [Sumerlaeia bacterium]
MTSLFSASPKGKRFFYSLLYAIRLVWRPAPRLFLANGALLLLQGLLPLAALALAKLLVDELTRAIEGGEAPRAGLLLAALAGVLAAGFLVSALAGVVQQAQAHFVTDDLCARVHAQSVALDLAFFEDPAHFDNLRLAQTQALTKPLQIVTGLAQTARTGITVAGLAVLIGQWRWEAVPLLALAGVPGLAVRLWYSRRGYDLARRQAATERRADYYDMLLRLTRYAQEVRLYGLGGTFAERFRTLRRQLFRERLSLHGRRAAADFAAQLAAVAVVFALLWWAVRDTAAGAITLGTLVLVLGAIQRGQTSLADLLRGGAMLYENQLFLALFRDFLAQEPRIRRPASPLPVPRPMARGLALEDVRFRYPGSTRFALDGASLRVGPGEIVALVGENGAGKSTVARLLARLYDPQEGRVTLDGEPLPAYDPVPLRRLFGAVTQDFVRYDMTAAENIAIGEGLEPPPPAERIAAAARDSGADPVLRGLPRGYDTPLGKYLEDGAELSLGQWQKVALARAFLREDAQVIVLDEPSSALDPRAEAELFARARELLRGRAALLISHRLSSVRIADRIYVLHEGRVAEEGSHDELVARGGIYAEMFEVQASRYR